MVHGMAYLEAVAKVFGNIASPASRESVSV
jgi:hypothetical protein